VNRGWNTIRNNSLQSLSESRTIKKMLLSFIPGMKNQIDLSNEFRIKVKMNLEVLKSAPGASCDKSKAQAKIGRILSRLFFLPVFLTLLGSGCKTCECPAYSFGNEKTKIKVVSQGMLLNENKYNIISDFEHIQKRNDQKYVLTYQKCDFADYLFRMKLPEAICFAREIGNKNTKTPFFYCLY
jgi:hypothetical protein